MDHKDLRDWLDDVEEYRQLVRVNETRWDLEMSSIVELIYRKGKDPKPAILFDEIPEYPKGYRTLFGMLGSTWRIGKTLGLPEDRIDRLGVAESWYKKSKDLKPIPPMYVNTSPVIVNRITGEKIDILKFPVLRFHEFDGGRYIGTAHAVIQRDPDDGWVNLGTYRVMIVGRNLLSLHAVPGKHGNIITYEKYFNKGKVMPIAIAICVDPVLWWLSCQRDTP